MKTFRFIDRIGPYVAPILVVSGIIGFHGQPLLWIPLVVLFLVLWVMGIRVDRRRKPTRKT